RSGRPLSDVSCPGPDPRGDSLARLTVALADRGGGPAAGRHDLVLRRRLRLAGHGDQAAGARGAARRHALDRLLVRARRGRFPPGPLPTAEPHGCTTKPPGGGAQPRAPPAFRGVLAILLTSHRDKLFELLREPLARHVQPALDGAHRRAK